MLVVQQLNIYACLRRQTNALKCKCGEITGHPQSVRLSVADLCFTGAIFSSMAAVEIVSRMSSTAIHNTLYTSTLATFPGAVFLLLAALSIICVVLLL